MKVYLNEEGYAYLHAYDFEDVPDGYIFIPDDSIDIQHFVEHRNCYKYEGGSLAYHPEREEAVKEEGNKNEIRIMRESICFPVINRGWLWYQNLTEQQIDELSSWYKAWLDAPQTMTTPEPLEWI